MPPLATETLLFDAIMREASGLPDALTDALRSAFQTAPGPVLNLIQGFCLPAGSPSAMAADPVAASAERTHDFEARLASVLHASRPEARERVKTFWRKQFAADAENACVLIFGLILPEAAPHRR